MGRPIGTTPLTASSLSTADQTAVSVGPYMFQTSPHSSINRAASVGGSDSPPQRALRLLLPRQPDSTMARQVAGVACNVVALWRCKLLISAAGSHAVSRVAITTFAPTVSGNISSNAAMSNDKVVIASKVSLDESPGWRFIEQRKLTTARCGNWTPFGFPVEPEV